MPLVTRSFGCALAVALCASPAAALELRTKGGVNAGAVLLGRAVPEAADVRDEVERTGFYAGEALGAGDCARCHGDVVEQFSASAHRFASFANPYYAAAVLAFREARDPLAARFCADCHDPLVVADGALERPGPFDATTPAAQAGITCLVCHSVHTPPDLRGNGGVVVDATPAVLEPGAAHKARLGDPVLRTARFCGGCHKVGLTESVTGDVWLRGQNEYDAWYDSAWAGRGVASIFRPPETRTCQDCHMPREPALRGDKAARDGAIRSHRFLASNTALPHLRGDADHLARTQAFLGGGVVTLRLATSAPGTLDVVLRNRGAGHAFPGGTSDSNEAWLEVRALGATGKVVGQSGALGPRGELAEDTHVLRAQPVDAEGRPLRRRDVHRARGVVFDTSLPPGDPRVVRFALPAATARVQVRLLYRKFSKEYAAFACDDLPGARTRAACLAPPTTRVATAEADVSGGRVPPLESAEARLEHALGLGQGLVDAAVGEAFVAETLKELATGPDARIAAMAGLGLARLDVAAGRWGGPPLADEAPVAALWSRALGEHRAHRDAEAFTTAAALEKRLPDDRAVLGLGARLANIVGRPDDARRLADRLLAIDPESEEALLQRLLALRALGADASTAEATWARHRRPVERELRLRRASGIDANGAAEREAVPVHVHRLEKPR
jgi:hypothetical protein